MCRTLFPLICAAALAGCVPLTTMPTLYPPAEPLTDSAPEYEPPQCDWGGHPLDCSTNVHFEHFGAVTIMRAPMCVQVTVRRGEPDDDPTKLLPAQTYMGPHTRTVIGTAQEYFDTALCLQFPLREPLKRLPLGTRQVPVTSETCSGRGGGSVAACFSP